MSKCILLTGGGTAGHVTPNLALVPLLREKGYDIHYAGTADGLERQLLARYPDIPYHIVQAGKLRRYLDIKNLSDPFRTLAGIRQAKRICREIKPDVVFSKGGFVSLPVVMGAHGAGVPCILHESDYTPGLANKLAGPYAKVICTTFPETAQSLGKKAVYTGTPVRPELFSGDALRGRRLVGFSGAKPVLLIIGGSQGAAAINQAVRDGLPRLKERFDIIHLCGKGKLDETLLGTAGYVQMEYASEELPDLFAAADIVLSRAGSNTLCELIALEKPHVLVPLPLSASRGDQILNANSTRAQGFSAVLPQENLTPQTLYDTLCTVYLSRRGYISAMRSADYRHGAQKAIDVIEDLVEGKTP
nr:undecaprenyldiphospho-muramoylpentapeptide beta-N-acetylglucosaminyltransferase [bacterium]